MTGDRRPSSRRRQHPERPQHHTNRSATISTAMDAVPNSRRTSRQRPAPHHPLRPRFARGGLHARRRGAVVPTARAVWTRSRTFRLAPGSCQPCRRLTARDRRDTRRAGDDPAPGSRVPTLLATELRQKPSYRTVRRGPAPTRTVPTALRAIRHVLGRGRSHTRTVRGPLPQSPAAMLPPRAVQSRIFNPLTTFGMLTREPSPRVQSLARVMHRRLHDRISGPRAVRSFAIHSADGGVAPRDAGPSGMRRHARGGHAEQRT